MQNNLFYTNKIVDFCYNNQKFIKDVIFTPIGHKRMEVDR
jgi:hypothetical protein